MKRYINIILTLVLMGGCTADDGVTGRALVSLCVCGPDERAATKGDGVLQPEEPLALTSDDGIADLACMVYSSDGLCVWSGRVSGTDLLDPENLCGELTIDGGRGKSFTAVVLANYLPLDATDDDGLFVWDALESLTYAQLRSLTFDASGVRGVITAESLIPMYGETVFTAGVSTTVTVALARVVDKLTLGSFETAGELARTGVSFGTQGTKISLSFRPVPRMHVDGTPSTAGSDGYSVCSDLESYMRLNTSSFYFLPGSTAVFSFPVGGETLSYSLTPSPPSGGQRGNIHYVMTRGVFSSTDLRFPEFSVSVEDWNAAVTVPETI